LRWRWWWRVFTPSRWRFASPGSGTCSGPRPSSGTRARTGASSGARSGSDAHAVTRWYPDAAPAVVDGHQSG